MRYVSGPREHRVAVVERKSGVSGSVAHFVSLSGWTGYSRLEHNAMSFPQTQALPKAQLLVVQYSEAQIGNHLDPLTNGGK